MHHFISAVVARMLQSMSGQIQGHYRPESSARFQAGAAALPAGAVPKDNVPKDNAEILELVRLLRE